MPRKSVFNSNLNKFKFKLRPVSLIKLTLDQFVYSGFHIGGKLSNHDRLNYHFIFGFRQQHILSNLQFTLFNLKASLFFLTNLVSRRGKILFIDDSPSHRFIVAFFAKTSRQYFCNQKWISGTLTNFRNFYPAAFDGSSFHFTIFDGSGYGFRALHRIPNAVCLFNLAGNVPVLAEVIRLGIPSVSLVNSDFSLSGITFPIFSNSKSLNVSILFLTLLRSSILNGYRTEIYKFFRDSLKVLLKRRLNFLNFGKFIFDNLFSFFRLRLFFCFYKFFLFLIKQIFLFYDFSLLYFLKILISFFYFFFKKKNVFFNKEFFFNPSHFFLLIFNSFFSFSLKYFVSIFFFINYFFNYFLFKFFFSFLQGGSENFIISYNNSQIFFLLGEWFFFFNLLYRSNFIYPLKNLDSKFSFSNSNLDHLFSNLLFKKTLALPYYSTYTSNNSLFRLYHFQFFARTLNFRNFSLRFNKNLFNKIFIFFDIFSKFKSYSFLFSTYRFRYKKTYLGMLKFFKSSNLRLKLKSSLRSIYIKYVKFSLRKLSKNFFSINNSKKNSIFFLPPKYECFSEFAFDDYVDLSFYNKEELSNFSDWRLFNTKFRVFFNSIFLLEEYLRTTSRIWTLDEVFDNHKNVILGVNFLKRRLRQKTNYAYLNFLSGKKI